MDESKLLPPAWAAPLGRIPSGLFILTVAGPQGETGMLASWVQQCSFEPPLISIAVKKGRYVLDWLTLGSELGINILPEGNKKLLGHFGKGFEPGEPAFDGLNCDRSAGQPTRLVESLAFLRGQVRSHHDTGDHVLVIAEVLDGQLHDEGKPAVHHRKNGQRY